MTTKFGTSDGVPDWRNIHLASQSATLTRFRDEQEKKCR